MRFFLGLILSLLISSAGYAAEGAHHTTAAADPAFSTSSSNLTAVGVSDTTSVSGGESLSAMFSTYRDWIQVYVGVFQTKNVFDFGVGGAYKFTLAGNRLTGFHVGPGVILGTVSDDFAFSVFGAIGGHFTFLERLIVSIDAGPMVNHTQNNTNIRIRPLGNVLGLSAFYLF